MEAKTLKDIWNAIPWDEPRDARDISKDAGVNRGRTCEAVRAAVRIFRDQGLPVVSDGNGFQKTIIPARLAACAQNLFIRANAMNARGQKLVGMIQSIHSAAQVEEEFRMFFSKDEQC